MKSKRDKFIESLGGEIIETTVEPFNADSVSYDFIVDLNRLMAHHNISSSELKGIIEYYNAKPSPFTRD